MCYFHILSHCGLSQDTDLSSLCRALSYNSRTLFFIHSVYNSLHLLMPNSQAFPPTIPSLGNHRSVLYVCESVSIARISSLVSYFRFHKHM